MKLLRHACVIQSQNKLFLSFFLSFLRYSSYSEEFRLRSTSTSLFCSLLFYWLSAVALPLDPLLLTVVFFSICRETYIYIVDQQIAVGIIWHKRLFLVTTIGAKTVKDGLKLILLVADRSTKYKQAINSIQVMSKIEDGHRR